MSVDNSRDPPHQREEIVRFMLLYLSYRNPIVLLNRSEIRIMNFHIAMRLSHSLNGINDRLWDGTDDMPLKAHLIFSHRPDTLP